MTQSTTQANSQAMAQDFSAIIVAGGRGSRMGGKDKALLPLGGHTFVDALVQSLPYGTPYVVVSPHFHGYPTAVERPLYGGPLAGVAAGWANLEARGIGKRAGTIAGADTGADTGARVAILAVDAPHSGQLLPALAAALDAHPLVDAAVVRAADGYRQPLCALWRAEALGAALREVVASVGTVHNRSMRTLMRHARIVEVPGTGAEADADTPADALRVAAWR